MEMRKYLGNDIVDGMIERSKEKTKEFMNQSAATKLAVADEIQFDLNMHKEGLELTLDALKFQVGQKDYFKKKSEIYESENKDYRVFFGDKNFDFINKTHNEYTQKHNDNVTIINDEDDSLLRSGFEEFIKTRENYHKK